MNNAGSNSVFLQCPKCQEVYDSKYSWLLPEVCLVCCPSVKLVPYNKFGQAKVGDFIGE